MAWAPESVAALAALAAPTQDARRPPDELSLRDLADATTLEVLRHLDSRPRGLTEAQAEERLERYGENVVPGHRPASWPVRFARGLRDPFTAVLLCLGLASALVASWGTACVITVLVLVSSGLRSRAEYQADRSAAGLRDLVAATVTVQRRASRTAPSRAREIPVALLVPGDVIRLVPGDVVPADALLLRSNGLTLRQAALTGESGPVGKQPVATPRATARTGVFDRPHLCFQGSGVESGSGAAVVVATGAQTEFALGERDRGAPGHRRSAFDHAVNGISWLLIRFMLITPPLVLVANAALRGRGLETLPFAVAVAVGLTPEMLPVVVTTVLAGKAAALARDHEVIVRWLPALHNLGAIDVLCTDKTGTLTLDRPRLDCSLDADGRPDPEVLHWAAANSLWTLQLADLPAADPLDEAILDAAEAWGDTSPDAGDGVAALPFDPVRRLATAVLGTTGRPGRHTLVVKGAVEDVLERCTRLRAGGGSGEGGGEAAGEGDGEGGGEAAGEAAGVGGGEANTATAAPAGRELVERELTGPDRERLLALSAQKAAQGLRVLAVALAERPARRRPYTPADEHGLTFTGFVALRDRVAPTAAAALGDLTGRGVSVKIVTGDHPGTAAGVCRDLGFDPGTVVTADRIDRLTAPDLAELAQRTTVFARCTPQHKARIVRALREHGHTTGFLGDGVNDLPAMHASDVGISPRDAADVTRDAADVVLAAKDLTAIHHAITAGRRSTGAIGTYLRVALSSNLGNVIAMLAAGLLLPFLPMLPAQVLLQNLCFDAAQLAFTADRPGADAGQLAFAADGPGADAGQFAFAADGPGADAGQFAFTADRPGSAAPRRPTPLRPREFLRFITAFGLLNAAADLATFAVLATVVPASIRSGDQSAFHAGWFTENLLTQAMVMLLLLPGRAPTLIRTAAAALAVIGLVLPLCPPARSLGLSPLPLAYYPLLAAILLLYGLALTATRPRP